MAYECSNCNISHSTKNELLDHMHEKHNCTFLEGDYAPAARARLAKGKDSRSSALLEQHRQNNNEV